MGFDHAKELWEFAERVVEECDGSLDEAMDQTEFPTRYKRHALARRQDMDAP